MDNFEGKIAFVTGATSGIGRARANCLARAGASVAIVGRRRAEGQQTFRLLRETGGDGIFIPVDLAREANCAGVDLNARLINYTEVDFSCPKPSHQELKFVSL